MIGNSRASSPALASPRCVANLASAYAVSGSKNEAAKLLSDLKTRAKPSYSYAPEIAVVYAALGDRDQAMNWLQQGYEGRFNPSVLLRPGFDSLRSDPRFQELYAALVSFIKFEIRGARLAFC